MQLEQNNSWGDPAFVEGCVKVLIEIEKFLYKILISVRVRPQWSNNSWINNILNSYVEGSLDKANLGAELEKRGVWAKFTGADGKSVFLSDL